MFYWWVGKQTNKQTSQLTVTREGGKWKYLSKWRNGKAVNYWPHAAQQSGKPHKCTANWCSGKLQHFETVTKFNLPMADANMKRCPSGVWHQTGSNCQTAMIVCSVGLHQFGAELSFNRRDQSHLQSALWLQNTSARIAPQTLAQSHLLLNPSVG